MSGDSCALHEQPEEYKFGAEPGPLPSSDSRSGETRSCILGQDEGSLKLKPLTTGEAHLRMFHGP